MIRKKTVMILLSVFILTCSVPGTSIQVYANSDETVKTAFKNYIGTVLIPQYGLLLTNTVESTSSNNWTEADLEGLLSATIMDFDNDGQLEMMTVRFADYNGEVKQTGKTLDYLRKFNKSSLLSALKRAILKLKNCTHRRCFL